MNDAPGVILAAFVIAASVITIRLYKNQPPKPAHVVAVEPDLRDFSDWRGPPRYRCSWAPDEPLVDDWRPPSCVGRKNDDHCFRDLYRAQLEALEANTWYDEVQAVSPTGASFARRTVVRHIRGRPE